MSISTSSIFSCCSQSSSGMSGLPTPRTGKSAAEHHAREGARKVNQVEGWRRELSNKINVYDGDIDSYLDKFVPSRTGCSITPPADASLASELLPGPGQEVVNYGPLVRSPESEYRYMSNTPLYTDGHLHRSPGSIPQGEKAVIL